MYWFDLCKHNRPHDKYLGSFQTAHRSYDVWVYQDNASYNEPDMHLCIRYGSNHENYISPGNIKQFINTWRNNINADEIYIQTIEVIDNSKYLY